MAEYEDETVPSILLPCTSCSRTFRPEALAKHTKYCEKTLIKKRKVFDSAKQRIQGTDLAEFLPVLTHKKKVEKSPIRKTQSKWKEKHMELVRAIRAARVGSSSEELPPAPVKPSDHEQCPHCDRYFGPKAYDRHLEWCKEHSTRIQPKSPASIQAKERLEARTKYRAPVLAKSRRTVTKEKYQLQRNRIRDPSPKETPPKNVCNRLRDPSPMERNKNIPSSQVSLKQPAGLPKGELNVIDSASRLQLHRSSRRHPSPMKKTSVTVRSRNSESTKNISIQKEVSHLTNRNINNLNSCQDKEDIFSSSCNISSIRPVESPKPKLKVASNTSTSASHNSAVPIPAEACEFQHLKRRYIRKEKPILNGIHVNDDIAGMTVYACRPASVITNYTSQNLNNYNKENYMEENVDETKNKVLLGSTCINRVITGSDHEEECNIKNVTVESVESMDVNYSPFVDERKSDNKSDISILSYTSSVAKESCSIIDQPDVVCPLNCSDFNKNTHVTLSKGITSDGVAGTYDYGCTNFEEGSKNGLKNSSWNVSLQDCLTENNLLINSCVDLASVNVTQNAHVSESFSDNKDFIADENGFNNSKQFDDYINRSSTPTPQVTEIFDLEDIPRKKKYNNVESLIYSCDSLDNSCDKIPKTVFDDDFSSPVKRRRCDSPSDLSQLVDVLFISDSADFNKSSVCSDYNTSKENDISSYICEKDSANSPKNYVINNNKCLPSSSNDFMNMDMELCMDCQRSKSDSDLYNFNNNVLKCCYERKARMCKLQQIFLMPNHKSEIERLYSDDSEEHESFSENEASNTEKKNSSELNNLQINNTEFTESEVTSVPDEWTKVRSSTFVVDDKDIKNSQDINQNFMYHRYSDTAVNIRNKNDSFITAALPNSNGNTNDMMINSSQKKCNNGLNLCSSSMTGDKLNYGELNNDYFDDNSQVILCDTDKIYPEEQIFDIKTMCPSPKCSEIDMMCKRVSDNEENCEAIKKNKLSDENEIYPFEIEELELKDNGTSFEGAGYSISTDEFSSSEETILCRKVETENSPDNKNHENLPNFENSVNSENFLQSKIPPTGSNITISIVDVDTPEFIYTNKYADYKNCKKVVENHDSYSDLPYKREMFCNDKNVSIATEIQEECVCNMVEALSCELNCEPELKVKHSFDYSDVENSDDDREFLSDSLHNKVECFEYSASEKCYVSFRTEISRVENQLWRENYVDNENSNNQAFLRERSESYIEHSFLPPLKIKLPKKPPLKSSLKEAFKNIKMKNSHLKSNSSTKNPKIPKLTTWQLEAEKDQTFPPVNNFYLKKNDKLDNTSKPLKLPQLTVMRKKCNQINKSVSPSKLPQLIMNGENVFYQKAIGSDWSRVVLPRVVKHVVTAILPKRFPVVSLENYDPYKSAERQMKELLGLEDDVTTEIHHEEEDNKEKKEQISCISQTNIISSPTSAFAKFSPIEPARSPDFLENDFIPPPEKFDSIHNQSSHSIIESDCVKDKNQNPISLSSLSLCSTISIDSVDSYKNNFRKGISTSAKVQSCDKKVELPLKRSISAVEPHRKGRDFLKSNLKMEHLLFGFPADNYDRFLGTPINDINPNENKSLESLSLSNESLKRSDSVEETSRAEQELLKSMSEFEKLFESPLKPVPPLIPSSNPTPVPLPHGDMNNSSENSKPETQQLSTGNKFSSDSAYNSLNRKSPQMNDLVVSENEDTSQLIASGGTEGSFTSAASQNSHAARFCHECGSKYPVLAAKFCCHCGVRRLVI